MTNEKLVAVNGIVYDVKNLLDRHPTGHAGVEAFLHADASRMFPRIPPALLTDDTCLNKDKFRDNELLQNTSPVCKDFTEEDKKNGLPCHDFVTGIDAAAKYMGEYKMGELFHDKAAFAESQLWVAIYGRVYNVTEYVNSIRNEQTSQIEMDHPLAYLEPTLNNLVITKLNEDATDLFESVYPDDRVLKCLDELFYVGTINPWDGGSNTHGKPLSNPPSVANVADDSPTPFPSSTPSDAPTNMPTSERFT